MATKHHTVILVPHAQSRLRKWRVTNVQVGLALGAFTLAVLGAGVGLFWVFAGGSESGQVQRMNAEIDKLRETNRSFEETLTKLQKDLGSYESRTRKLAIVAGIENLDSADAGVGGAIDDDLDLAFVEYRAKRLATRLDQVEHRLEERLRWFSSTPSITPVKGIVTSGFGARRDPIHGAAAYHPAIDIAAPPGRPVHATADGIVTQAADLGMLGNAVTLSHGFGVLTRYGHMSRLAVEPGQTVKRGDVVGFVGNTGRSTGYHLHYEVHVDGEAINPLAYILDHGDE
jgi:murein DD-endopeptidase MepM/ murein hydrolase activator NlpD